MKNSEDIVRANLQAAHNFVNEVTARYLATGKGTSVARDDQNDELVTHSYVMGRLCCWPDRNETLYAPNVKHLAYMLGKTREIIGDLYAEIARLKTELEKGEKSDESDTSGRPDQDDSGV